MPKISKKREKLREKTLYPLAVEVVADITHGNVLNKLKEVGISYEYYYRHFYSDPQFWLDVQNRIRKNLHTYKPRVYKVLTDIIFDGSVAPRDRIAAIRVYAQIMGDASTNLNITTEEKRRSPFTEYKEIKQKLFPELKKLKNKAKNAKITEVEDD